jgi:hypothetical protein
MITDRVKTMLPLVVVTATAAMLAGAGSAQAAEPPVKEILTSHTGGFSSSQGVAGGPAPAGNVYVADAGRVQELTASGGFVLMWADADPGALAVDPSSGNVYVAENALERVSEFTSSGQFVLMIGKEVNETTKGDVCTQKEIEKEGVKCKAGKFVGLGTTEHDAFVNPDALAAGGPEDLLYVGDEHRVQEFEADGKYKGEIREPLEAISPEGFEHVSTIAVDKAGDAYLLYRSNVVAANVIHEFDPSGKEIKTFPGAPREPGATVSFGSIALDPAGRLAVTESEGVNARGSLYEVAPAGLHLLTEFPDPFTERGIAFNGNDQLYASSGPGGEEVAVYNPVPVGELLVGPATCVGGVESETDSTLNCKLNGEVNPWEVSETEAWFQWGRTPALGSETPKQPFAGNTPVPVSAEVQGVRPNETLYDQVAGEDHNVKAPEQLSSVRTLFRTPSVPPRIVGVPSVSFVHSASAVMFGELNPENTNTQYEFQYVNAGACGTLEESCPGVAQTVAPKSSVYGKIATTLEATGLQPATLYRYRLFALNDAAQPASNQTGGLPLPEGTFTTAPAPVPQAFSGPASAVTATSAVVSGSVNADGQPATYTFELGIYNGPGTQYGIVFSGPAGAVAVTKTLALTGLQPGTTYAYRITITSGYGTAQAAAMTFTTSGLPEVLSVLTQLPQLAIPNIAFPRSATSTTKALTNAQKLANAIKACRQKPRKQRAACERSAHKKYPAKTKKR